MSAPSAEVYPHHRLSVRGILGGLSVDARIAFGSPWTVLFGASGSGKSTLLRAMAGLANATTRVEFSRRQSTGEWVEFDGPRGSVRPEDRGIAFAPQEATLLPHLDVRANLLFPARMRGVAGLPVDFDEVLTLFHLTHRLTSRPRELSGGERQRVNVARALLVPGARLLLLDEPLNGVDRELRAKLLPALRVFATARGLPVVSVTHEVDEPLLLAAEVARVVEGKILAQGPADVILARERDELLHALQAKRT